MKNKKQLKKLLITLLMLGYLSGYSQIKVSGKVIDTKNEPLPGAEIIIVGTDNGTVTDFDGNYEIIAKEGDKIKVSYYGMNSVTKVVSGPNLDFVLKEDALGLDEIVVTAQSGDVTKRQLGTVIHSVKMDKINSRNVSNVSEALQGALPGAQIMRNSGSVAPSISIRLRGPSTILGNSDPLIMIDGIIINNQARESVGTGGSSDPLSDIDMNDIERIEVLKGPAASAMYGSLASNGIIQIFTKKGKTGEPTVTINSNLNFNNIRKYKPYNKALFEWSGGVPVPIEKRYDYQSYVFDKTMGTYNGVKVTGGTEWTSYSIGGSILQNDGIIRNSSYNRKNIDLKLNQKVKDWLRFNVGIIYSHNNTKEIPYASGSSFKYAPLQSLLFADNSINPVNPDGSYNYMGWQGNPYESIDKIDATLDIDRIISNFSVQVEPVDNLKIDYLFGYDFTNSNSRFLVPYGFTANTDGDLQYSDGIFGNFNSHLKANYQYNITENIKASTGAGYQYMYDKKKYNSQSKPSLPIFPNLEGMDGANDIVSYSSIYEYAIWGTWVQQNFSFNERVFLTLGGRWDKASTFGEGVQTFYPKVSGSVVVSDFDFWKDNLEKYINSFKIRGAWGEAGNMSVLTSPALISVRNGSTYTPSSYLGQTTYILNSLDGNKNIRPEVTREYEFGFDASFADNRIGIEFTLYHQDVYDLLLSKSVAYSTGFSQRVDNVGTLTNDGIELTLKAVPIKTKDFNWDLNINYSKNKNVVSNIEGGYLSLNVFGNDNSILVNGHPMTTFYGTFYATDDNGNWVLDANGNPQVAKGEMIDNDGDGFPESYEQHFDSNGQPTGTTLKKILGKTSPDYIVSFNNTFRYKNFGLNINIEAVQGYNVLSWDKRMAYSLALSSTSLFTGWEFAGIELENNTRGFYGNRFRIYEAFIEDGSFIKLRNISLSYNWKNPLKGIKNANFSISGSNLISIDNYWGYDPEVNSWGKSNVVRGQDYANIPIPKVYSFGVQLKF